MTDLDTLNAAANAEATADPRPPVWIGHLFLETPQFSETFEFLTTVGLRSVVRKDNFAVLELRGGTHIVLRTNDAATPAKAPFDLMVDDIDQYHQLCRDQNLEPTDIHDGSIHRSFEVQEPGGLTFKFNDSHAVGPV
ncbi:MAG: hypothetical protein ACFB0C_21610 [Leptolyngbyaceae cyanobacterium]